MKFTLQNVRLFVAGADLTTQNNKLELAADVEEKDATAFVPSGDAWKEVLGGIRSASVNGSGQWEADDTVLGKIDDTAWTNLGANTAITACPATAAVGSLAWLSGFLDHSYQRGGAVGDVAPWTLQAAGSWPLVRGVVAHDPGTSRSASGTGTSIQIGATAAGKYIYAALHVLSVSGSPTLTARVEADNATGFPSPVTVLTFNAATAKGGQVLRAAGPLTDDWIRAGWTISGTGSVLFLLSVGIA